MIDWQPTTKLPAEGQKIWVLCSHWKGKFPGSFRIFAGTFVMNPDGTSARVDTDDEYGEGSWAIDFPVDDIPLSYDELARAWAPADAINVPLELLEVEK